MNNQYCTVWAVKVFNNACPIQAGDMVPVVTKAGKAKTETVLAVLGQGSEEGQAYTLVAIVPKQPGK